MDKSTKELLAQAEKLCAQRNVRLTPQRLTPQRLTPQRLLASAPPRR